MAAPALTDLRRRRDETLNVAHNRGARRVRVFGSVARGDAGPGSDIDFLVELEAGRSLFDLGGLLMDLLFSLDVDLPPKQVLTPARRRARTCRRRRSVRSDRDRLLDTVEMCDRLIEHATDPGLLATDPVVQAAAQRWIEILGAAASRISDATKNAHPEIAWRYIVGMCVILAHAYFDIDVDIVGRVITDNVPRLRQQLQALLDGLDGDD